MKYLPVAPGATAAEVVAEAHAGKTARVHMPGIQHIDVVIDVRS